MRIARFLPATEVEGPGLRAAIWVQGCSIRCPGCCNPEFLDALRGRETPADTLADEVAALPVEGVTLLGGEPLDQPEELFRFLRRLREQSDNSIAPAIDRSTHRPGYTHADNPDNAVGEKTMGHAENFNEVGPPTEKDRKNDDFGRGVGMLCLGADSGAGRFASGLNLERGMERGSREKGVILFTGYSWDKIQKNALLYSCVKLCDLVKTGPFLHEQAPDVRRWIGSRNQQVHFLTSRYETLIQNWPGSAAEIEIHLVGDDLVINGHPFSDSWVGASLGLKKGR